MIGDSSNRVSAPNFNANFQSQLFQLMQWRRDVRRFRDDPVSVMDMDALITAASLAPSVGFSQPWRFVRVGSADRRRSVLRHVEGCNTAAASGYDEERAKAYRSLKLHGLKVAPEHLAVFCDETTHAGHGLGRQTMPEMLRYSCITAVHNLWLAARAKGIGVGWVSILEPTVIAQLLDVPDKWLLIAYLCIGYPQKAQDSGELERAEWQAKLNRQDYYFDR